MKKKLWITILIICAAVLVLGIVMIAVNGTPYLNCSAWLREAGGRMKDYAMQNIVKYAAGYYGGIFLTVAGALGVVISALFGLLRKKPVANNIPADFN